MLSRKIRGSMTAAALLGVSACGGVSYGGSSSAPQSGAISAGASLKVTTTTLGKVLVDAKGRTVYMLTSDHRGRSNCPSTCLGYWPPVPALTVHTKPAGVTGKVGSTADTLGNQMTTVGGWPLYTYVGDKVEGDVTGEGVKSFGGTWYAMSPAGKPVTSGSGSSSSGSTPGRGY